LQRLTDVTQRVSGWFSGRGHSRRVIAPTPAPPADPAVEEQQALANGAAASISGLDGVQADAGVPENHQLLINAFDAAHPVARRRELRGREEQLEALFDGVLSQRKHAIIHGARGSGKTSLVRVFADHADRQGVVLIYLACDAHSDFVSLMRPFIRFVPSGNIPVGRERAFRAEVKSLGTNFGPRALVSLLLELAPKPIIFILDEFDRVTDHGVQDAIATTMKLLSDAKAPAQLLVVGIAQSVTELIEHHPSLRRHMTAVSVGRIADGEIARLLDEGAERARIAFNSAGRNLLVRAAAGSPYHARLFAYHAGFEAMERGQTQVDLALARAGLRRATEEWSRVNEQDHALFERLIDTDAGSRARLMEVATLAARDKDMSLDRLDTEAARALRTLSPALEGDSALCRFRDSLAAQFFIAMLLTSEPGADVAPRMHADLREQG